MFYSAVSTIFQFYLVFTNLKHDQREINELSYKSIVSTKLCMWMYAKLKIKDFPSHFFHLTKKCTGLKCKITNVLPNNIKIKIKQQQRNRLRLGVQIWTAIFRMLTFSDSKTSNEMSHVVWRKILSAHRWKHIFV